MTKTFALLLLCALSVALKGWASSNDKIDSLLIVLETTMSKRELYDTRKKMRIETLTKLLDDSLSLEMQYKLRNKIADEYQYFSFDNALSYLEQNLQQANEFSSGYNIIETKIRIAKLLVESGRYKESVDMLGEVNRRDLPESLLFNYYLSYKDAYSRLAFYSSVEKSKQLYYELRDRYQDSLTIDLDKNTDLYLGLVEGTYRDNRELDKALQINTERLSKADMGSRLYSLITFERSLLYQLDNKIEKQKEFLILSAMSDIQASVKDNASMAELALILFKEEDIDRAHSYINFSMEDAKHYNSRLRFLNITNILPVITKAYESTVESQKAKLTNFLILISVLGLILLITLYYVYKQVTRLSIARNKLKSANNKLKDLNAQLNHTNDDLKHLYSQLSESDKIKEKYIGTFLNLYSEYIGKLDMYKKMVRKYIVTNKTTELLELVKSKQLIDEELKLFNKNFDESFLHIYPNFIDQVNALLTQDNQIEVKQNESLNTELRILALIRLGITNSVKISEILRYSVNTIYNYRVKLKNGAISDREMFEDMVKSIT